MSPIPTALILLVGAVSLWLSLNRSVGAVFTYVLLPGVLLAFTVPAIEVQKLPDISIIAAASYGTLLGVVIRGPRKVFSLGVIDIMVVLLALWRVLSGVVTDVVYTGVSTIGNDTLTVLGPYFMARATFVDPYWRVRAAKVIAVLAAGLAFVALIEWRLIPMYYSRQIMSPLGLTTVDWVMVQGRFGFFRAQASFCHPIDLGNGGAILGCMLLAMALTCGRSLKTPWVLVGGIGCTIMVLTSMSFTSYVAVSAIGGLLLLLRASRIGAYALLPIGLVALLGYSAMSQHFIETEPEAPAWEHYEQSDETSGPLYVRHFIVHSAWEGMREAGVFGIGKTKYEPSYFGLASIDNSYALFVLNFGWGYLVLFLLTAFVIAFKAMMALVYVENGASRLPLAAGVAGVVGTALGMYTVFFGFVYATLFWMLLGMLASMIREVQERAGNAEPVQLDAAKRFSEEHAPATAGAFS